MSLKKEILFNIISRQVENPKILNLVKIITFHNPTDNFTAKSGKELFDQIPSHKSLFHVPKNQGLPIGNLTSQFFANVYLNELDQFVKHNLKVKFYLRYIDDFLLLSNDVDELKKWQEEIDLFLQERLGLKLNHKKQVLEDVETGIDWLGYVIKPGHILARKRVVKNFKQKLYFFNQELQKYPDTKQQGQLTLPFPENYPPLETIEEMLATINSYFGHFQHADTFHLRKNLLETKLQRLNDYIEPKNPDLISFRIKADFKKRCKKNKKFL
ncbi:MAG: RNA-directed DNA polymerase [Candidatus Pacebacteria bacterium]|nr:RNA-directed DNA polymerase [Candidatus Paceibacterota bacterium]